MKALRAKQVAERLACSVATVWRRAAEEDGFPKPVRLGPRHTAWIESEVTAYLRRLVAASRAEAVAAAKGKAAQ